MLDLMRAEWQKMVQNRWVVGMLVWIFPVGAAAFSLVAILISLFSSAMRENFVMETPLWTVQMIVPWQLINNVFGRMLLMGFTAVTFAGEYQWGTWKNIVPRRRRAALLLAKFITLGLLILFSMGLMSLIWAAGQGLLAGVVGIAYGPSLAEADWGQFLRDYTIQAATTFTNVMITAVIAALAGMIMRSILGAVMVGLGISIAEPLSFVGFLGLAQLLDQPRIMHLFRLTPFYNLDNITAWLTRGEPSTFVEPMKFVLTDAVIADSVAFSITVLAAWMILGVAAILLLFQRQDITT